jgi:hypothetical protein
MNSWAAYLSLAGVWSAQAPTWRRERAKRGPTADHRLPEMTADVMTLTPTLSTRQMLNQTVIILSIKPRSLSYRNPAQRHLAGPAK